MAESSKKIWKLTARGEKRFSQGHPWVYSNELAHSPKGIDNGELVKLVNDKGKFLAWGFGHVSSLIAFRILCRDESVSDPLSKEYLSKKIRKAMDFRKNICGDAKSYRLFFSETDGIPGLIIDRYKLANHDDYVDVVQFQSSGVEKYQNIILECIKDFSNITVLKNDSNSRLKDGLEKLETILVKGQLPLEELALEGETIKGTWIEAGFRKSKFFVDFISGQKTGFFLDQSQNLKLASQYFEKDKPIKVLDLFCYHGQWSQMLAQMAIEYNVEAHLVLVDSSKEALMRAELALKDLKNRFQKSKLTFEFIKSDIMKDIGRFEKMSFDWVICDPPALIKSRKDINPGKKGYIGLNEKSLMAVKNGGRFVTCSCSGLLSDDDFIVVLSQAVSSSSRNLFWISRSAHAPDHPVKLGFPEGRYLKTWIGVAQGDS